MISLKSLSGFWGPFLINSVISGNKLTNQMFCHGAGIYIDQKNNNTKISHSTISNNIIQGNNSEGAGIYVDNDCTLELSRVTISNNLANSVNVPRSGGGIFFSHNSNFKLINSTIYKNSGSGLFVYQDNNVTILNSIFWENTPFEINSGEDNIFNIAYSDFLNGRNGIEASESKLNWLEGNIELNPEFKDPENGDFNLMDDSPCIEKGISLFDYNNIHVEIDSSDYFGNAPDMGAYESSVIVSVKDNLSYIPTNYMLYQNYPNPFNPKTKIKFELAEASNVTLKVYDISGKLVRILLQGRQFVAGTHEVKWDSVNKKGILVATGVYFYELKTNSGVKSSRKMLLLR